MRLILLLLLNCSNKFNNQKIKGKNDIKNRLQLRLKNSLNNKFIEACNIGNVPEIKDLLVKGADINHLDIEGRNSLSLAMINRNKEVAKLLIDNNIKLNQGNGSKYGTPLIISILLGWLDISDLLITKGANINSYEDLGQNILMIIIGQNKGKNTIENLRIIEYILDKDININHQSYAGETALIFAIELGDLNLINLLLEKGADPNIVSKNEAVALAISIKVADIEITRALLNKGADPYFKFSNNANLIMYSCQYGNFNMFKSFIDFKFDLNHQTLNKDTALYYAAKSGNSKIIEELLKRDINPLVVDLKGNTAAHTICKLDPYEDDKILKEEAGISFEERNYEESLKILLDGIKEEKLEKYINKRNNKNETALEYAIANGNTKMVKLLVDKGAYINKKDEDSVKIILGFENLNL